MRTVDHAAHAQVRCRILEAARRLFAAKGYHAASMNDVAHDARLAKAAVYHYFKGKQALLEALHEDLWADAQQVLGQAPKFKDLRAALRYTGAAYLRHFSEPRHRDMMMIAFNVSAVDPELMNLSAGVQQPRMDALMKGFFEPYFPKGTGWKRMNLHLMPFFGALFHYLFVIRQVCPLGQAPDEKAYLDHLAEVFSHIPQSSRGKS